MDNNVEYSKELNFFLLLMQNMNIHTYIHTEGDSFNFNIDLGLREKFYKFDQSAIVDFDKQLIHQVRENIVLRFTDSFLCQYLVLRLPNVIPREFLFIGPFTMSEINQEHVLQIIQDNGLNADALSALEHYYSMLPLITTDMLITAPLDTLAQAIWGSRSAYKVKYQNSDYNIGTELNENPKDLISASLNKNLLENTYRAENELLMYVRKGQLRQVDHYLQTNSALTNAVESHIPDSLRNCKNYLIIVNTLLRKSAEQGGVHPIYIHEVSRGYAIAIEQIKSTSEMEPMMHAMSRKYCRLVYNHSTKAYSKPVEQIVITIDTDLTADLSLKRLASDVNMNASYLSTLFKKEVGESLIQYVNKKRIEHALLLLNTTDLQVQSIAEYCGIPDLNYFTRTFKKIVGKTPSQYRDSVK